MAKYFITFVLLAFLAMENNNIYNRLHARSQPSSNTNNVAHFMRHQQYRHQTQPLSNQHPTHDHHQTHHARKHVKQHQRHNADNGEEEDNSRRDVERRKRHMEHQMEHRRELEQSLHQRKEAKPAYSGDSLKTMPRLWQHLSVFYDEEANYDSNERMYGDGPAKNSLEYDYPNPEVPISVEEDNPADNHQQSEQSAESNEKPVDIRCPKCERNRQVELISEEELTSLRIEYVKQQILDKLRLKERPHVPAVNLPKPLLEGRTFQQEDDESSKKDVDDYYARTSKKFIFLDVEKQQCSKLGTKPSMCFSFKLDDSDAENYEVSNAVLWIFKNKHKQFKNARNQTSGPRQTIVVSEVQQKTNSNDIPTVKTIAAQAVDVEDEWMKIDIEWPIKRWFGNHELSHLIQITCKACDMAAMEHLISTDNDYRPFIMVNTQSRPRQSRQKRTINCSHGVTECCREKLYISFADIGWGDWIIEPKGYDAYFCRGSCNTLASVTSSSSHHSSFLQKLLNKPGQRSKNLEMVPCCTAKSYSSLQLLYLSNNSTGEMKTFPNMVIESCGCR